MAKATPKKSERIANAITAKMDAEKHSVEASAALSRFLEGSYLEQATPLSDEMRIAVQELVTDAELNDAARAAVKKQENGICNNITGLFFDAMARGTDPQLLNVQICMTFGWACETVLANGQKHGFGGENPKNKTFGKIMSMVTKVSAHDGVIPRKYTSSSKKDMTLVKRYNELTAKPPVRQVATKIEEICKILLEHGGDFTLPQMTAIDANLGKLKGITQTSLDASILATKK